MKTAVHQYEDKLLEFAYGELPAHEASAVDAHVRGCARCGQALDEIRAVRSAMQLPAEPAPDAGLESLLAFAEIAAKRNAEAGKPVPFWKKYLTPLVLVATMVTVGVVATQATKEVDLSPAAAASDKTASEYSRRDERKQAQAEAEAKEAEPTAVAPAPAPVLAQQGDLSNAPDEKKAQKNKAPGAGGEEADGLADALGTLGKRGTGDSSGTGGMQSVTRREVASKGGGRMNSDDFAPMKPTSKVVAEAEKAPPPPTTAPPADKTVAGGYGLTGGLSNDYGNAGRGVALKEMEQNAKDQKPAEDAPQGPGLVAANEPARTVSTAPAPAAPKAEAAVKPEPKPVAKSVPSKKSKSMSLGSSLEGSASAADEEAFSKLDTVGADGDAKLADRQRAASASSLLEQARLAAKQGDRKAEVSYAAQAVSQGASGSARLEALTHLCNGYEALGQFDSADGWCDALLREFPNSASAQTVTQRRGASQQYRAAPTQKKSTSMPAATESAQ